MTSRLFNDAIKAYWIGKIEQDGHLFDPDYGNSGPRYEGGPAAPFTILLGEAGKSNLWADYEKEFQLPRWILEVISTHMHDVSPSTSAVDLLRVFKACPTYVDLDLLYHTFSQHILMYCIEHFSDIKAQLAPDAYFGAAWVGLLTNEKRQAQRVPKSAAMIEQVNECTHKFEYWGGGQSKYEYFGSSVEAIKKRYTGNWPEYLTAMHTLKHEKVENIGTLVLDMLVKTLRIKLL